MNGQRLPGRALNDPNPLRWLTLTNYTLYTPLQHVCMHSATGPFSYCVSRAYLVSKPQWTQALSKVWTFSASAMANAGICLYSHSTHNVIVHKSQCAASRSFCAEPSRMQVHPTGFSLGRVQISRWQLRSRHILYMVKTKDLYSAYCPTGGCTHHPLFCLSLSTARLLHSYVQFIRGFAL